MKTSRKKTAAIIVLAVLCAFQTINVWFGADFRNFGNIFSGFAKQSISYSAEEFLKPYRNIIGRDGSYFIKYGDFEQTPVFGSFVEYITLLVKKGTFSATLSVDYTELFSGRVIACEYRVPIPSDAFSDVFGGNFNIDSKTPYFDAVLVLFDESAVCFFDRSTGKTYKYHIDDLPDTFDELWTSSVEKIPLSHRIESGVFIPEWNNSLSYYGVRASISFEGNDGIRRVVVENNIKNFFENPNAAWSDSSNGVLMFGEGNIVVKYHTTNVLEYSNYYEPATKNDGFAEAFFAAEEIIKKDKTLANDYYLSSYGKDGESYTFNFDLFAGNFPVILPQSQKESIGMDSAITVVVT
ncbi:MAG: hypothetical protein LBM16_00425, partial [Clostridiales bacterium]|nr:hypothetical protein [Clostridiales bacterium]